jgi:hypothetical protein
VIYRNLITVTSLTMVAIGLILIVLTVVRDGVGIGLVLGMLFVVAGSGRLWLIRRRPR